MQPSNGGPRIKLNRNVFKLEQEDFVPKRRRLSRSSEYTVLVDNVHATASEDSSARAGSAPRDQYRVLPEPQDAHQEEPARITSYDQGIPASRHKQIYCHLHLAVRYSNRNVRPSSRAATSPNAGYPVRSVANQGVIRVGVKTRKMPVDASVTEHGRTSHLGPNLNRNAGLRNHFGSISRLESARQVKRSVKISCCALCGDRTYTPPACTKLTHAHKSESRHLSQPKRLKEAVVQPVAQTKMKPRLKIWVRRQLRVKLCDVAHVFDVTSGDFSCILPAVLLQKRAGKKVNCFSKEFRSLMRLESQCRGNCGKWIGNQSCEAFTPTNRGASFLSGDQVLGFSVGENILNVAEDMSRCSKALGIIDHEKVRQSSVEETACLPEPVHYGTEGSKVASEIQVVNTAPVPLVPHLFLSRVHAWNGFAFSQRSQHLRTADNFVVTEGDTNDSCLVQNGLNACSDEDACIGFPDCFSCRRTTVYMVRPHFSCARTYRPWPFPRNGPPCELQSVIHTGPRWIVSADSLEGTEHMIESMPVDFRASSECMAGKDIKERLEEFVPHEDGEVQNNQEQEESTIHTMMMLASSNKTLEDQSGSQKHPQEAWTSVNSEHSCGAFQHYPAILGSVPRNDSQAVDFLRPDVINRNKLKDIPADLISAADTKSADLDDSSINKTHRFIPSKCLENPKNDTEATTHFPDPLPDLQQSALQTSSDIVHSGEEPQTSTILMPLSEKLKHCFSMMQSNEQQKSDTDTENRSHRRINHLHSKTTDQSTFSTSCPEGSTQDIPVDSLSSRDEDSHSLSPAQRPADDAPECSRLQDKLCEIDQANRSPSRLPALEGLVVTGGDFDVIRAYEEDAIVLDVIHDDPDLFGAIVMSTPENSALNNPTEKRMCMQADQTTMIRKANRIVWGLDSKRNNLRTDPDVPTENNNDGRGHVNELDVGSNSQPTLNSKLPTVNPIFTHEQMAPDCNNNQYHNRRTDVYVNANAKSPEWTRTMDNARSSVYDPTRKDVNIVRPLPPSYCWFYFCERSSCLRISCRFLHVPREDDEKFCMDTLDKFCSFGRPPLVQRAVEIFVAYYKTNSPGVSYSESIVNQLLSCLLSLALLKDLLSVINTLHAHKRTTHPEFVIALFEHVRERGILNFIPELILLTSKIIEAGCVFSMEQCEMMQLHLESLHVPQNQMDVFFTVKCRALATDPRTTNLSQLAQAVVRVELCKQLEDWVALARVFCTVFRGSHSAGELSRFGCCVTVALLKESKDKLTLSYEPFAVAVCQEGPTDEMTKSFLGRVGVSLMFTYHRNQDWTRGLKLLRVMSRLQIEFALLKGLFSSEKASRCQLLTAATEFFLNSGSIEGALNMLKANEWFVSSNVWPCEQADIQNRRRLLTLLAKKTSYRDTLEVLTNLPGLKQPLDGVHVGEYSSVFNAHLRRCVKNRVLPVGANTLDFMLTHAIPVDPMELQQLLHKLGKQNSWTRARTLFKCAQYAGYYSGVVYEKDSLALPCCLTEIEMTLAFEMLITSTCTSRLTPEKSSLPLLITLKRGSGHEVVLESEYLAAGSRLLSAAFIPNPKLIIRYTAVSQEQEQLFHLDRGSAAKWLSHNRSWAQGMWSSSHTHSQNPKQPFNNRDPDRITI